METVDLCIVATPRPEILKKTLDSFLKYIKFDGIININVNIDLIPKLMQNETICVELYRVAYNFSNKIAKKNYRGEHIIRVVTNTNCNFAKAVKTVWKITETKYVFHLEDDWEFLREIDLNKCISMIENDGIDYIRFPKVNAPHLNTLHKIALQPSFWRGNVLRELSKEIDICKDPEKQLRVGGGNSNIDSILDNMVKNGLVEYCSDWCCDDIGREWREKNNIKKVNGKWMYE